MRARAVLVWCAVPLLALGAAGISVDRLAAADRDRAHAAPEAVLHKPQPEAEPAPAPEVSGLAAKLLPVPAGFRPGEDVGGFGGDTVLDADQASDLLLADAGALPPSLRADERRFIAGLKIRGAALRTYRTVGDEAESRALVVQVGNRSAGREFATAARDVLTYGGKQFTVPGHDEADCASVAGGDEVYEDTEKWRKALICVVFTGDLYIELTVYGPESFSRSVGTDLLDRQLDHLANPGDYV